MTPINSKQKYLSLILLTIVVTIGSLSVTGLLQSIEKITSSGVIVRNPPMIISSGGGGTPQSPPPEPKVEIDVFTDRECTRKLTEVIWGEIGSGDGKNKKKYVKKQWRCGRCFKSGYGKLESK